MYITPKQVELAAAFKAANFAHVKRLEDSSISRTAPTPGNMSNPKIWKGGHWRWFADLKVANLAQ